MFQESDQSAGIFGLNLQDFSGIGPHRWNLPPESSACSNFRPTLAPPTGILFLKQCEVSGRCFRVFGSSLFKFESQCVIFNTLAVASCRLRALPPPLLSTVCDVSPAKLLLQVWCRCPFFRIPHLHQNKPISQFAFAFTSSYFHVDSNVLAPPPQLFARFLFKCPGFFSNPICIQCFTCPGCLPIRFYVHALTCSSNSSVPVSSASAATFAFSASPG